jgi:hypothetical protein
MSHKQNLIGKLFKEIDAIYDGMAARHGLLTDAEFDAIEAKRSEIEALLNRRTSPKQKPQPNTPNAWTTKKTTKTSNPSPTTPSRG